MGVVFISYSHKNSKVADEITKILDDANVNYFRDIKKIEWGNSITKKVTCGLQECSAVLVIISPASNKSDWVPFEIGHAMGAGKIILPFLTDPDLDVPAYINDLNYISDLEEVKNYFSTKYSKQVHKTPVGSEPENKASCELDEFQIDYLLGISSAPNNGAISDSVDRETGRNSALYQEALELFLRFQLMVYSGGNYKLTSKGWKLSDSLWELKILNSLQTDKIIDDTALASLLKLPANSEEMAELERHAHRLEEQGFVKLHETLQDWSVQITHLGVTHRKHNQIEIN